MIINQPLKQSPLELNLVDANPQPDSTELLIKKVANDDRKKRLVNRETKALLALFLIKEHDSCLVYYLAGKAPHIKNNKEAVEFWVKAESTNNNVDELNVRFKKLLSRIDPTVDLSEF